MFRNTYRDFTSHTDSENVLESPKILERSPSAEEPRSILKNSSKKDDNLIKRIGRDSMVRFELDQIPPISPPDFTNFKSRTFRSLNLNALEGDQNKENRVNTNMYSTSPTNMHINPYSRTEGVRSRSSSPESYSDSKFKRAEKIFVPHIQSDKNWYSKEYVDELQKFYQKERETLKQRIDRIYKENDDSKLRLLDQIEDLKKQAHEHKLKHKEEIIHVNTQQSDKLTRIMRDKDSLLADAKNQIYELKSEVSQLTVKYTDLNEEYKREKFELQTQIDNLSQQLNNQLEIFDSTRSDYEYRIKSSRERYELEKVELKKEYEQLINNIRSEHSGSHQELTNVIRVKNKEIDLLRKEMTEIKLSYNTRITEMTSENSDLLTSLKSSQKLADMQMRENKKLIDRKSAAKRETKILQKEITLLEQEHRRVVDKNQDLKERVDKLDKLVYGAKMSSRKAKR
ncbi:unnamed protein product [Moneuplotes crassus]|uniref:Uncharacterized protein n=1 Tax=Euplotes crassus TaxID=5936 RepID=A0AAD1UFB3_EUPCR|nr:unnamed protein product [Moneuplotes crassus]